MFEDSVKTLRRIFLQKRYTELLAEVGVYIDSKDPACAEKMQETFKIRKEMDEL